MRRSVCSALGVVFAFGCSSSSGPGSYPTVTQIVPMTAATGVALNSDVVISFSEPLSPASVTSSTVKLTYNGTAAPATRTLENGNRDVRLTPNGTFGNNRKYQVDVTTGVKSPSGAAATAFTSTFTTLLANAADILDAAGDTFGTNAGQQDLAGLGASQGPVTIVLSFNTTISPWNDNVTTSVGGYIDIDADQNSATGFESSVDIFRPASDSGASDMGDEFFVSMFQNPNGTFTVYNLTDSLGVVTPTFDAHSVTVTIPLALLGNDDGNMNITATVGSQSEATDIGPSDGHLTLGNPGIPAPPPAGLVAAKPQFPRRWIAHR